MDMDTHLLNIAEISEITNGLDHYHILNYKRTPRGIVCLVLWTWTFHDNIYHRYFNYTCLLFPIEEGFGGRELIDYNYCYLSRIVGLVGVEKQQKEYDEHGGAPWNTTPIPCKWKVGPEEFFKSKVVPKINFKELS